VLGLRLSVSPPLLTANNQQILYPSHFPCTFLEPIRTNTFIQFNVEGPEKLRQYETHFSLSKALFNVSVTFPYPKKARLDRRRLHVDGS
jgi:hypothetical protein